ncbi:uncharacterized mitochondrial protein-like protein [Tanacetum coccineum]
MVPRTVLMKSGLVSVNIARQVNSAHSETIVNVARPKLHFSKPANSTDNPQMDLQDKGVIDSGCSRNMTGNMSYLTDYEEIDGEYVAFGGNPKGRKITGKCTIKIEAVNTAYYVQNRVLVVKPHNKIPYELFHGRTPTLSFIRPFGCSVTILNTIDYLGKFDGKADEGFFVGYSLNSKAFRVFNSRTNIVEENLHIMFSENTPNIIGSGPDWLFDIDALTRTMNYKPIVAGTQSNGIAGTKASDNAGQARKETEPVKNYILLPLWPTDPPFSQDPKSSQDDGSKPSSEDEKKVDEDPRKDCESIDQEKDDNVNSTNNVNAANTNKVNAVGGKTSIELLDDPNIPALDDYSIFDLSSDDQDDGAKADMNNLDITIQVVTIPKLQRIHNVNPLNQVIGIFANQLHKQKYVKEFRGTWVYLDFPDRVYEIEKALYGLHQAPKAWYETLSTYLLDNGFERGKIDKTLFIRRRKGDILLVQVYVDDIIFGSTNKKLCIAFEKLMHEKFQMSSMGELTFFLGLEKFGFTEVKTANILMETQKPLLKDKDGEEVDVHMYRSMIGLLDYLNLHGMTSVCSVCLLLDTKSILRGFTSSCCEKDF